MFINQKADIDYVHFIHTFEDEERNEERRKFRRLSFECSIFKQRNEMIIQTPSHVSNQTSFPVLRFPN